VRRGLATPGSGYQRAGTGQLEVAVLWLIVLLLVILAIVGGWALTKLLFALLIVALVLALMGLFGNRSTL
jgi:4-hydroxybenzoate polyprenyltransferase